MFTKRSLVDELRPHVDFTSCGTPEDFAEGFAECIEVGHQWECEGDPDVIQGVHKFIKSFLKTDQVKVAAGEFWAVGSALPTIAVGTKEGVEWYAELESIEDDAIAVYKVTPLVP